MHKNELFIVIKGNGITYTQITGLTCRFKLYQENKNFNVSVIHVVDARKEEVLGDKPYANAFNDYVQNLIGFDHLLV